MTPLLSQTVWVGELERENERERKEGIFRERGSNFSLDFLAIEPSVSGEARRKVVPHGKGYAWAPVLGTFVKLRKVRVFSYSIYSLFMSLVNGFVCVRPEMTMDSLFHKVEPMLGERAAHG